MATFRIPTEDGFIRQLNKGDVIGELWATKNIDLTTSPGKIKLALPLEQAASSADLSANWVEAMAIYGSNMYVLTDSDMFRDASPYTAFTNVTAMTSTGGQDLEVFSGNLAISLGTDIGSYDGSTYDDDWWTNTISGTALTSGKPHILHVQRSGRETISVTDDNKVRYYNSNAGHTTITLDTGFVACCQTSGIDRAWVGTYTETGAEAQVYEWSVGNSLYTRAYPTGSRAVLAMEVVDDIPYIVTERGEIKMFNNVGFTTVATLPMWYEPVFLDGVETGLIQSNNAARPVHPKGMRRYNDSILINFCTEGIPGQDNVNDRSHSGTWEFDPKTLSLTHKNSIENAVILSRSAPIMVVNDSNSRFYCGGTLEPVLNATTDEALWREDLTAGIANYGYIITPELKSDSFQDVFDKIIIKAQLDTNQKIIAKYRTVKELDYPVNADGGWSGTKTLNSTDDLSAVYTRYQAGYLDEIEIMSDSGSGQCTHIVSMTYASNTYSMVLEDAIGTDGGVCRFRVNDWQKIDDEYNTTEIVKKIGLNVTSARFQLKLYMEGYDGYPEIHEVIVKTNSKNTL